MCAMEADVFVHPLALNESLAVGAGTRIWAFAHVMRGARVGPRCNIGDHAFLESGAVLGEGVTLKNNVCVWEGVVLEDYVFVGPHACFTNDRYPRSPRLPLAQPRYADKSWCLPVCVRRGASIGANATVLAGITIGAFATIAAGSVATRDVPPFALMMGCPARRMGWVCACGHTLEGVNQEWFCRACARQYATEGDGIVLTRGAVIA